MPCLRAIWIGALFPTLRSEKLTARGARTLQVVTSARQASLAAADRLVNGLDPVPGRLLELRGERLDAGDGCQQKSAEAAAEAMTRGMYLGFASGADAGDAVVIARCLHLDFSRNVLCLATGVDDRIKERDLLLEALKVGGAPARIDVTTIALGGREVRVLIQRRLASQLRGRLTPARPALRWYTPRFPTWGHLPLGSRGRLRRLAIMGPWASRT
jgi:hypothetical protein